MFIQVCQSKKKWSELDAAKKCVMISNSKDRTEKRKTILYFIHPHFYVTLFYQFTKRRKQSKFLFKAFVTSSEDVL